LKGTNSICSLKVNFIYRPGKAARAGEHSRRNVEKALCDRVKQVKKTISEMESKGGKVEEDLRGLVQQLKNNFRNGEQKGKSGRHPRLSHQDTRGCMCTNR
jgi:hypothetical protein